MNANFRGNGASPTNDFWHQKSRFPGLSYGEKKIAEKFNRLSRVHQRHRQTDRQTDNRQTTDGRLIAYSERNVVRSLKMRERAFFCHFSASMESAIDRFETVSI